MATQKSLHLGTKSCFFPKPHELKTSSYSLGNQWVYLEPVWELVNCFLMSLFARHIVKILVHNHGHALPSPRLAHSFRYVVPRSALKMAYNNSNHKFPNRLLKEESLTIRFVFISTVFVIISGLGSSISLIKYFNAVLPIFSPG